MHLKLSLRSSYMVSAEPPEWMGPPGVNFSVCM